MATKHPGALVRRGSSSAIRRALGFLAFLPIASRAPLYTRLMWELVRDERTPASRKALLAGALGYLVLGRDVIPDDIPVLGGLDDLVWVLFRSNWSSRAGRQRALTGSRQPSGTTARAFD